MIFLLEQLLIVQPFISLDTPLHDVPCKFCISEHDRFLVRIPLPHSTLHIVHLLQLLHIPAIKNN